jgi:phage/plasmid-like protein (TIGR03299 family)
MSEIQTIARTATSVVHPLHADPLDVLGTDVSAEETFEDVLKVSGLANWGVHLVPLQTASELITPEGVTQYGPSLPVPDQYATVRTSPVTGLQEVIGVVGDKYHVTAAEELEEFMLQAVELTGGTISRAGDYYRDGRRFFLSIDLPDSVLIGGRDLVNHNLTIFSSHDGSTSIRPVISNVRVFCQNQRNYTIKRGIESASIRHTASAAARLATLQTLLKITLKESAAFDAKAEAMINVKLSDETFWEIVSHIHPSPKDSTSQRSETIHTNRLAGIRAALEGPENANIRGTAWAGYSAVTSQAQHGRSGKDAVNLNAQASMTSQTTQNIADAAEKLFYEYALSV